MTPNGLAIRTVAAVLCTTLAGLACTAAPAGTGDTGFPLAYYHGDCAPWDGLALSIVLTHAEMAGPFEATYPNLRITSYRPPSRLAGSSVAWTGAAQDEGYAALCDAEAECRTATSVRVRFDGESEARDRLTGSVRVELEGGDVVEGPFEARRIAFQALCG